MAIWGTIGDFLTRVSGAALSSIVEAIKTAFAGDPQLRRQVAFSVAMIALSAKMAKADGIVTHDEVRAFREIFSVPPDEVKNVARLYDLAKRDVAGFESYARQMAGLCGSGAPNCAMLEDIVDGLFHIATADGVIHEREVAYLYRIAQIFAIEDAHFRAILARHSVQGEGDPFIILGIGRDTPPDKARSRYRELVKQNHPDRMIARGLPPEFVAIATRRLAAINDAWSVVERSLKPA